MWSAMFEEFGKGLVNGVGREVASAVAEWVKAAENRETVKKVATYSAIGVAGLAAGVLIVSAVAVVPVEAVVIVVFA
ncbi:hypothetical protein DI272_20020 [Streptomyces sp. Act143]|nr:hypothetical protein DI272_20020 [Streptomyces sp. Act143]